MKHIILMLGGILLLVGAVYYYKSKLTQTVKSRHHGEIGTTSINFVNSPDPNDIVLASLITNNESIVYAILWNSKTATDYTYTIEPVIINSDSTPITAKHETRTIKATGPLVKIKDVPISPFNTYKIVVGNTNLEIHFDPPTVTKVTITGSTTAILQTTYTPTDVEVIIDSQKIPATQIGILGDLDPGVTITLGPDNDFTKVKELIVMIYNGPNVVHIFTTTIN